MAGTAASYVHIHTAYISGTRIDLQVSSEVFVAKSGSGYRKFKLEAGIETYVRAAFITAALLTVVALDLAAFGNKKLTLCYDLGEDGWPKAESCRGFLDGDMVAISTARPERAPPKADTPRDGASARRRDEEARAARSRQWEELLGELGGTAARDPIYQAAAPAALIPGFDSADSAAIRAARDDLRTMKLKGTPVRAIRAALARRLRSDIVGHARFEGELAAMNASLDELKPAHVVAANRAYA